MPLRELKLRAARARIAELLAPAPDTSELGSVRLRPHQREMVARVRALLARHGGCLLADEVGRGKTYVALAVARAWQRPLIVIPASLRATWAESMRRAGRAHGVVTHEALSRGQLPAVEPDGIIVDEAHRFRNAGTRRHAALARLASRCPVLLLSATPVQNGTRDLAAQLALFLGSGAFRLDEGELVRHVVRGGDAEGDPALPALAPPRWVCPKIDDGEVLRAILALPPPPRPTDGGDAGALRAIGLVRAWASSRAALRATLARRRRLATAIEQSMESGRLPSRRELRAWEGEGCDDGAVQLGLVPLLVERTAQQDQLRLLARQVDEERRGLEELERVMRCTGDPDQARCDTLRAIRAAHPDERLLCFAELATTVRAYHSALRREAGVGMLTASEARIASGRLGREELLARFAPTAQGSRTPIVRERVTLLLATDLLSEGLNLQDASVVVHLDLPWNPARLTQRVGRVRRAGGAAVVHSYLLAPPASSELLLRVEERLRRKLADAARSVGASLLVIPPLTEAGALAIAPERDPEARSAAARARMLERVARWRRAPTRPATRSGPPLVAGVEATRHGWLVALSDRRLIASLDGAPPDDGALAACAVALAEGKARALDDDELSPARAAVERWLRGRAAERDAGIATPPTLVQLAVERRLGELLSRAPRHARGALIPAVAALRHALRRPLSLGAERELSALMDRRAESADEIRMWLGDALALVQHAAGQQEDAERSVRAVVMIIFAPDRASMA